MTLLWKGTSAPVAPLLKGQRGQRSRHTSILRRPCAYYSTRILFTRCRLQRVTVMNVSYQRSPETEQFITAKIIGNAFQQSRTHSVLRQRSAQLQQHKAARMSHRIAVDQNVCGGDGGHPVDSSKFVNYTIIENAHKVRKIIFVFLCGCYMYNCWEDRTDTGLCEPLWSSRLKLPINDEARNEAHIASTGVRRYKYKKRNGKLLIHHKIS